MRIAALFAVLALSVPTVTFAQTGGAPDPIPIAEWDQARVIAMGQEIQRQDVAAWVATDALMKSLDGAAPEGLTGWIVVPDGGNLKVRFLKREGDAVTAGWDVVVRNGRAGAVEVVADGTLSPQELARYRARQTAAANVGRLRCSQNLNSVVARDPDGDGWLVWLLTSTTDANIVPMGGHYRFRISADGATMLSRDMLSNSCLPLPKSAPEGGARPAGLVVTQIVSNGPVETHVFLSLQNRIPIYVAAGDKLYEVNGARIREVRQ